MPLTAGTHLGPYEILARLGAGGMGEVYKARDVRLDRTVAIKVLQAALGEDPEHRQRLEREARAISSLDHPNICTLFDVGRARPNPAPDQSVEVDYLVMQFLKGESLAARLERGALPLGEALDIAAEIADALAAAHRRGIVHRDLKPGNVMLVQGTAVLLDFGLAKQAHGVRMAAASDAEALTAIGPLTAERTIVGTLNYMAPEQLEGKPVDARTDIFALGAVLYEMLTGARAFSGDSSAGVMATILKSQPPPLAVRVPVVSSSLQRVVDRCLAKDPEERWQSASDLAFELRSLPRLPDALTDAAAVRVRRLPAVPLVLAAIAGALAAALVTGGFSRQAGRDPGPELRLSILPPDGLQFATDVADYNPEFAISPDGRYLAFTTEDARGNPQLWVRPLDSIAARPLGGTIGARAPFWSPDSQHVAYVGPGGLARVALAGGAPQLLTSLRGAAGADAIGSWGVNGRILFDRTVARGSLKSLFVIDEAGGEPREVARAGQDVQRELAQRFPLILPDGRHFLYLAWTPDPAERGIYLGSFDSDERTLLVKTGFRAHYVEPGHLVYVRDRALVAERLTLDPPALSGEPQILVEGVALEAIPGQATFTASTAGVIAYRSRSRALESELRWVDRSGRLTEVIVGGGSDITVSLSPEGRRVLTTRLVEAGASEERVPANIWFVDLPRRVTTRLTLDPSQVDENPVWAPDGRAFVYASHRGSGLADVRRLDVSESGSGRVIASGDRNFHPIHWSRGGLILLQAYATGTGADDLDLWVMRGDGREPPRPFLEAPFAQAQGQFSPDGRWVAYTSNESGRNEVYVRPFPAGDARWQVSSEGGAQPRWRADGREIFYVSPAGTVMAVPVTPGAEFAAGAPVALFTEPSLRINNSLFFYGGAAAYDVDPDGQRFLVNRLTREPTAGPIHVVINAIR